LELAPWPYILDGSHIVKGERPFVFSRNINAGVRRAIEVDPDVKGFILTNDDCLLESPGGFTLLHETAMANPELGCIGADRHDRPAATTSTRYRNSGGSAHRVRLLLHPALDVRRNPVDGRALLYRLRC